MPLVQITPDSAVRGGHVWIHVKTYLSSVFLEGDLSITARCELYVPSSRALTGEALPSIRSYEAELKLILSSLTEAAEGIVLRFML